MAAARIRGILGSESTYINQKSVQGLAKTE
jgi:hypothetical protein